MSKVKKWTDNDDRFKELVLYISQKSATDPKFNTLKLNKLMFFADFFAFGIMGSPITGFEYQKLQRGPAPKRMPELKRQMQESGDLALQDLPLQQWKRTVNLRRPNLSVFEPEHVALIDYMIDALKDSDGDAVSELSHRLPCWIMPELGAVIPYEMVFVSNERSTSADLERGRVVAEQLGLLEHISTQSGAA